MSQKWWNIGLRIWYQNQTAMMVVNRNIGNPYPGILGHIQVDTYPATSLFFQFVHFWIFLFPKYSPVFLPRLLQNWKTSLGNVYKYSTEFWRKQMWLKVIFINDLYISHFRFLLDRPRMTEIIFRSSRFCHWRSSDSSD